jgi:electron transfer flavoprotein beta subunit
MSGVDLFAVAAAANLAQEVTAVTMGPASARGSLIEAMSLGADYAVHITDERLQHSSVRTTATVLSAAIKRLNPQAVFLGREATDSRMGVLGGMLAELLDWPLISGADEISLKGTELTARVREVNQSIHCAADYPLVVSVAEYGAEPKDVTIDSLKHAFVSPIEHWTLDDLRPADITYLNSRQVVTGTNSVEVPRAQRIAQEDALSALLNELASVGENL